MNIYFVFFVSCLFFAKFTIAQTSEKYLEEAKLFIERCSLCHGNEGMGEGNLPLKLADYPNTNLFFDIKASSKNDIVARITYGFNENAPILFMPPWKDELTSSQINALSNFILYLRANPESASHLLKDTLNKSPNQIDGKQVFQSRCTLCHGSSGLGNGRMSKIIKSPPPFNLTLSKQPKSYLTKIIKKGGERMSRSPQMPPWGDQLTDKEIAAVVDYILTLRR